MTMSSKTRVEMGLMAGVLATVVMTIAIIVATSISSALGYPWQIQWYTWIGSIFGAQGLSGSVAEVGVAWFIALSIVAGLIFAFAFREHSIFEGLAVGLGGVVRSPRLPGVLHSPPAHGHPADDVLHGHRRAPHPTRSLLWPVGPGDGARRQTVRRVRYCLAKPQNTAVRCDAT